MSAVLCVKLPSDDIVLVADVFGPGIGAVDRLNLKPETRLCKPCTHVG